MQICRCARHSTRCTSRVGMGARRVCGQSGRLAVAPLVAAAWASGPLSAVCLPVEALPSPAGCRAGIASAPLWDGEQGRVIGMLSASDFIHMLQVCSADFIPPKLSMPKQRVLVCSFPDLPAAPCLRAAPGRRAARRARRVPMPGGRPCLLVSPAAPAVGGQQRRQPHERAGDGLAHNTVRVLGCLPCGHATVSPLLPAGHLFFARGPLLQRPPPSPPPPHHTHTPPCGCRASRPSEVRPVQHVTPLLPPPLQVAA